MGTPSATRLSLEKLLAGGRDGGLLRFGIGTECLREGETALAVEHLQKAVALDPGYSAAWKLLGKALAESNRTDDAIAAYQHGIAAAEKKGDKQAMKEMQVFLRRLQKTKDAGPETA